MKTWHGFWTGLWNLIDLSRFGNKHKDLHFMNYVAAFWVGCMSRPHSTTELFLSLLCYLFALVHPWSPLFVHPWEEEVGAGSATHAAGFGSTTSDALSLRRALWHQDTAHVLQTHISWWERFPSAASHHRFPALLTLGAASTPCMGSLQGRSCPLPQWVQPRPTALSLGAPRSIGTPQELSPTAHPGTALAQCHWFWSSPWAVAGDATVPHHQWCSKPGCPNRSVAVFLGLTHPAAAACTPKPLLWLPTSAPWQSENWNLFSFQENKQKFFWWPGCESQYDIALGLWSREEQGQSYSKSHTFLNFIRDLLEAAK